MGEGDGDSGVVGVAGRVKLGGVARVVQPLVGVQNGAVLQGCVVVMLLSVVLDVACVVGVRPTQHQPPTQGGEARNWGVRDRGAFHAAGRRLR